MKHKWGFKKILKISWNASFWTCGLKSAEYLRLDQRKLKVGLPLESRNDYAWLEPLTSNILNIAIPK